MEIKHFFDPLFLGARFEGDQFIDGVLPPPPSLRRARDPLPYINVGDNSILLNKQRDQNGTLIYFYYELLETKLYIKIPIEGNNIQWHHE